MHSKVQLERFCIHVFLHWSTFIMGNVEKSLRQPGQVLSQITWMHWTSHTDDMLSKRVCTQVSDCIIPLHSVGLDSSLTYLTADVVLHLLPHRKDTPTSKSCRAGSAVPGRSGPFLCPGLMCNNINISLLLFFDYTFMERLYILQVSDRMSHLAVAGGSSCWKPWRQS